MAITLCAGQPSNLRKMLGKEDVINADFTVRIETVRSVQGEKVKFVLVSLS